MITGIVLVVWLMKNSSAVGFLACYSSSCISSVRTFVLPLWVHRNVQLDVIAGYAIHRTDAEIFGCFLNLAS
jgi:hypothetical protein